MGKRTLKELPIRKFEKIGDSVKGKIISISESKKFDDSFVLTLEDDNEKFVVFISSIVHDKIKANGIGTGDVIELIYRNEVKSKSSSFKYKDFEINVYD